MRKHYLLCSSPCSPDGTVRHSSMWPWRRRRTSPPIRKPANNRAGEQKNRGREMRANELKLREARQAQISARTHARTQMKGAPHAARTNSSWWMEGKNTNKLTDTRVYLVLLHCQNRWEPHSTTSAGRLHLHGGCRCHKKDAAGRDSTVKISNSTQIYFYLVHVIFFDVHM